MAPPDESALPAPDGSTGLDPQDWDSFRSLAHRVVDDLVDHLAGRRDEPVWRAMPDDVRRSFDGPLPRTPAGADVAYAEVAERVIPYSMGNDHPRFWGWYMGAGHPVGSLADLVASVINPNLGGADHSPVLVEQQVVRWCAEAAGYPTTASGLLVGGASEANMVGLAVARSHRLGPALREHGLPDGRRFAVYGSTEVHSCHRKSCELLGLGASALRQVPVDDDFRLDLGALRSAIDADRAAGIEPLAVVASAGTVNTGAVDDLEAVADLCEREGLWFHVDGAIGGFLGLSSHAATVRGLERADSLALDLHKWMQAPIDVGLVLVREEPAHRATFSVVPTYLAHAPRGISAGEVWFTEYGLALSRGFRALRVWMGFRAYGADAFAAVIDRTTAQARRLAGLVDAHPELQRLAPVGCDIVCLRYTAPGLDDAALDAVNHEAVIRVQESGIAVVTDTVLRGVVAVRVAIANHRTRDDDLDLFLEAFVRHGRDVVAETAQVTTSPGAAPTAGGTATAPS
ncbi:pyridoxal phosphate-dependent decarboxylase family protein [Oryzobacter telluris]|uniref:pyridoxal phosphate-dependent decarboxylase family protein n=1 Tax=Oryzobacter telluris TaxID=3149179 RepID=UPI00370D1498